MIHFLHHVILVINYFTHMSTRLLYLMLHFCLCNTVLLYRVVNALLNVLVRKSHGVELQ